MIRYFFTFTVCALAISSSVASVSGSSAKEMIENAAEIEDSLLSKVKSLKCNKQRKQSDKQNSTPPSSPLAQPMIANKIASSLVAVSKNDKK